MPNLSARCESLLDQLYPPTPPLSFFVVPINRPDRFKVIGFSHRATQQEIKQALHPRPFISRQSKDRSISTPRPAISRKQQHIPNHGK